MYEANNCNRPATARGDSLDRQRKRQRKYRDERRASSRDNFDLA
jgi:hypothetical protein